MATRKEIYKAIDGEREYQDRRWGSNVDPGHHVPAWLCFMQHYLTRAIAAATTSENDYDDALSQVRKVTALGVSCMEVCGVVTREEEDR